MAENQIEENKIDEISTDVKKFLEKNSITEEKITNMENKINNLPIKNSKALINCVSK